MTAPTCPVSYSGPPQGSQRFFGVGVDVASIPKAHDLRTVITAINRINNVVQLVTHGAPQVNNIGQRQTRQKPPGYARQSWQEAGRGYNTQKVINPDDPEQAVAINTLAFVDWQDYITGNQLGYTAGT